jgi:hypothetical protein
MTFLTIFTAPKPFTNPHIATIQRNAIQTWIHLGGEVDVILVGDEAGLAETAAELGARHLPEVARNEKSTPLVSSIFEMARAASDSPFLAYLNADILLLPDFLEAVRQVRARLDRFLLIGQRWDLDVTQPIDFSPGWEGRLRSDVQSRGRQHAPAGSDYFVFPRPLFHAMPEFAIGRAGWDNWMIFHARQQGWPVVDGTPSLMVIHQSHDYSHLPGGKPHYELEESQLNMKLAGGPDHMYMVLDADQQLRGGQIRLPRLTLPRLLRRTERWITPPDHRGPRWTIARRLRRWRRSITGDRA